MSKSFMFKSFVKFGLVGTALLLATPALAAPDFSGKSMNLLVGNAPGGGYDAYARLLARHMGPHLPGNPTFVVKNMPGGGGLVLANHLYSSAPRDGLTIAAVSKSIPFEPYFANAAAKYTSTEFNWLGTPSSYANDAYVIAVRADSPYKTVADLQKPGKPAFFGGTAAAQQSNDVMMVAKEVFRLNMELVRGYPGTNEVSLALARGEVQGFATGMSAIRQSFGDMLAKGELRMLVQFGHEKRWAQLPDVPTAIELAKTPEAKDMVELLEIPLRIARPYVAPPQLTAEVAAVLKAAFMATHADPQYLAGAEKLQLDVSPLSGDDVQTTLERFSKIKPELIEKYRSMVSGT